MIASRFGCCNKTMMLCITIRILCLCKTPFLYLQFIKDKRLDFIEKIIAGIDAFIAEAVCGCIMRWLAAAGKNGGIKLLECRVRFDADSHQIIGTVKFGECNVFGA